MARLASRISRYAWPVAALALPLTLLASSILTFRELREMRAVYLRDRAAAIAARLEALPLEDPASVFETLAGEDPALLDLRIFTQEEAGPEGAALDPIWKGRELFRITQATAGGEKVFRAYIPFHSRSGRSIARIDLAASAADFLVSHARHNLMLAAVSGLALLLLSLYAIWSARRTARLARRQLELEHLAHLGKMSAVLAHEIRNPLGTIKGFAQLAAEKADSATASLLDPILEETGRLERLVTDLLLYGRPPEPSLRITEWAAIARDLEAYARHATSGRSLRFSCNGGDWTLRTDPDILKQILSNLVRNAIEAAGEEGEPEVHVTATPQPRGGLAIAIEDNGPGIPAAARARLFEPFFTTKAFGTGLGLSIARKLAGALGGHLELESRTPRGTRAELIFPHAELTAPDKTSVWKPSS